MVILEIDGQKYGGQSYITDDLDYFQHRENVLKLAKEVAETVFVHYGYATLAIALDAILIEDEDTE